MQTIGKMNGEIVSGGNANNENGIEVKDNEREKGGINERQRERINSSIKE